ncbi:TIGR02679 family protein [Actinoplanes solisilvae]|uniref:TIGR02679 family protein n=1 Tax=Actinoplanes solisilvae TaxID=2486853 RepID=UPI000FD9BED8|nr:TIGR02679 family protein [Actinoplanes solisilvae]
MIPSSALSYLQSPALRVLWAAAHRRLSGNGRVATGRLTLTGLDLAQRDALGQLLARVVGDSPTVDLSQLDRRLRATAAGTGLLGVVEAVIGPIPDRRADAAAERERRALLQEEAQAAVRDAGLDGYAWISAWLPARLPTAYVRQAATVLSLTVGPHARTWSRGELAQAVTGSAHGLDDDTTLNRLVTRGLALALTGSADLPGGAAERRALWDAAGVAGDTVATTVLTYGLRPRDVPWLCERTDRGWETHLTLREVRRLAPMSLSSGTVFVCENPRVLEAAVDNEIEAPIVCTMGNPTTVTLALLDAITATEQVELAYHGDFDWPGVGIANRVFARYPTRPWQFSSSDYRSAVEQAASRGTPRQNLTGRPTAASWDPALTESMSSLGIAIHEEALIESLLNDLRRPR